jgi:hypothetical protein
MVVLDANDSSCQCLPQTMVTLGEVDKQIIEWILNWADLYELVIDGKIIY